MKCKKELERKIIINEIKLRIREMTFLNLKFLFFSLYLLSVALPAGKVRIARNASNIPAASTAHATIRPGHAAVF